MVKVADCTDVSKACTGEVDHLTTFTMTSSKGYVAFVGMAMVSLIGLVV